MTFTMQPTQKVSSTVSPVDAAGNPSLATLSNITFASSDVTIFTVAPDPATPNGAIVTGVAAGSGTLTASATATEADGTTTNVVTGSATIILTAVVSPAAALVFSFGTPS